MRKKRYDNGALSLGRSKLSFKLDESQNPIGFHLYEQRESNKLIEVIKPELTLHSIFPLLLSFFLFTWDEIPLLGPPHLPFCLGSSLFLLPEHNLR
jgi:hypothetical protein